MRPFIAFFQVVQSQAAIDTAAPGDTILVEPGKYYGTDKTYGLRIAKTTFA